MNVYLVSSYWSGALKVSNMRYFETEKAAREYAIEVVKQEHSYRKEVMDIVDYYARIYLLSPCKSPKRIKVLTAMKKTEDTRVANHIDGFDRDNLGESPDF